MTPSARTWIGGACFLKTPNTDLREALDSSPPEFPPSMAARLPITPVETTVVRSHGSGEMAAHLARWEGYVSRGGLAPLSRHPAWLLVLSEGLRHVPFCLEVVEGEETRGLLP